MSAVVCRRRTQVLFFINIIWSLAKGEVGSNPWDATTLEWQTPDTSAETRQLGSRTAGRVSLGV